MVNTPKANAVIERFFRSLKQECVWLHKFENFKQSKEVIDQWIKEYNEERPHQTLDYATPAAFYQQKVSGI
jgi:putative transposase